MRVKILTWNIWDMPFWFSVDRHKRIERMGKYLKSLDIDIIALQESFDISHRDLILKDLGDEYYITEGYDRSRRVFFLKKFDLTGGLVVYSRFPIITSNFEPFGRRLRYGVVEKVGRKGFMKTAIKINSTPVLIINTHLFTGQNVVGEILRQRQISNILDKIERLKGEIPTFLMGDLNANFEQETRSEALLLRSGFQDPAKILDKNPTDLTTYNQVNKYTKMWYNNNQQDKRCDYILVRDCSDFGISIVDYKVIKQNGDVLLSDHDPVILELDVN